MTVHRKRVKHYEDLSHCRELTFSCYKRLPLLTNDDWRSKLSRAIDKASERHHWRLTAFVFMPEHVHLLFYPLPTAAKIDKLLWSIKRPVSFQIKQSLPTTSSLSKRLTVQQRPGVTAFRFWQEGPGYDRNLETEKAVLAAIDYIHLNPVRRGLCDSAVRWQWSSARHYHDPGMNTDSAMPVVHFLPAEFFTSVDR
ncbi:MAG: transposase [Planctomycetia bacterium]|nr:transposase [Planctomycetia bacterium]